MGLNIQDSKRKEFEYCLASENTLRLVMFTMDNGESMLKTGMESSKTKKEGIGMQEHGRKTREAVLA
jgi:hypothetical protein